MAESLLRLSEVLLFGRRVTDLELKPIGSTANHNVTVVATKNVPNLKGHRRVDGVRVEENDLVLAVAQATPTENGIYSVGSSSANWNSQAVAVNDTIFVSEGRKHANSLWVNTSANKFVPRGQGNNLLDQQFGDGSFARIYGFVFEGTYYDLPEPVLFLVHGEGISATDNLPAGQGARAPFDPSRIGVGAADFQFANDIRVWAYDKADYTIRMDVTSGMFEQVLLELFFDGDGPMLAGGRVAGGRVAGGRVAGGRVAGGRVAGGRVAGGRVSGGRVSGSGD